MSKVLITCHGYTGYSEEMEPLGEYFQERGFEWINLTLPGHETTPEALRKVSWHQWVTYVAERVQHALKEYDEVLFSGLSMGGAMTLWVLENFPEIKAGVAFAPPFKILRGFQRFLARLPFLGFWIEKTQEDNLDVVESIGESHRSYMRHHTDSVKELDRFVTNIRRNLDKITSPLMIIHGTEDRVLPVSGSERIMASLSNCRRKELVKIESGHVILREKRRDEYFEMAFRFASSV